MGSLSERSSRKGALGTSTQALGITLPLPLPATSCYHLKSSHPHPHPQPYPHPQPGADFHPLPRLPHCPGTSRAGSRPLSFIPRTWGSPWRVSASRLSARESAQHELGPELTLGTRPLGQQPQQRQQPAGRGPGPPHGVPCAARSRRALRGPASRVALGPAPPRRREAEPPLPAASAPCARVPAPSPRRKVPGGGRVGRRPGESGERAEGSA